MDWRDLQLAMVLTQAGSLSAASRELELAPSTISRRIDALEQTLGFELFERHRTGYTLTPAGEHVLAAIEPMMMAAKEVQRRASYQAMELDGVVVVAAPGELALYLCQCLPGFRAQFPHIRLRLLHEHRAPWPGEVDLAIMVSSSPPEAMIGRCISVVEYVLCASRTFLEVFGQRPLEQAPWVVFDESSGEHAQLDWERAHVSPAQIALEVSSRALHTETLCQGLGVGLAPRFVVEQRPELVALSAPLDALKVKVWLLTHESLKDSHRVRAVMDYLAVACAELAASHALILERALRLPRALVRDVG